jgi:hypothetical protein
MRGVFAPGVAQVGWTRILRVGPDGVVYSWVDDGGWVNTATDGAADLAEYVPDLNDAATAGCVEEWVQELYADPHLHAVPVMGRVGDGEPAIRWRLARFGGDSLIVDGPDGHRRLEEPTCVAVWAAAILAKLEPK